MVISRMRNFCLCLAFFQCTLSHNTYKAEQQDCTGQCPPWPAHVMFHHLICGEILEGLWPTHYMLYRTLLHSTVSNLHYTVYTLYTLQSTLYSIQCTVSKVHCIVQCCKMGSWEPRIKSNVTITQRL